MDSDEGGANDAMSRLHPNQLWVLRIRTALAAIVLSAMAIALDFTLLQEVGLRPGLVPALFAMLALLALLVVPSRRYQAWSWREAEDELHVASGLLVRVVTIVPFGRVQHIDIAQGPIERRFGIVTLILHTAGTRGASVPLPGLLQPDAEALRDRIRGKIRQELA